MDSEDEDAHGDKFLSPSERDKLFQCTKEVVIAFTNVKEKVRAVFFVSSSSFRLV
jgi:hypothetical protein